MTDRDPQISALLERDDPAHAARSGTGTRCLQTRRSQTFVAALGAHEAATTT